MVKEFDHNSIGILLINLNCRPDRLISSQEQANKINLNFQRIEGVEPEKLAQHSEFLSPAADACFESHLNCLRQFLLTEKTHCIIIEDDFVVKKRSQLTKFLNQESYIGFDFIQLGFLKMGIRHRIDLRLTQIEWEFMKIVRCLLVFSRSKKHLDRLRMRRVLATPPQFIADDIRSGAHFYIVSRNFASKVLEISEASRFLPIDSLYGVLPWINKFKMIRATNNWVAQSNSPSSIKIG